MVLPFLPRDVLGSTSRLCQISFAVGAVTFLLSLLAGFAGEILAYRRAPYLGELSQANELLKQGKLEASIDQYQLYVRIRPYEARAFLGLGTAIGNTGDQTGQIKALKEAIRLDPNLGEAHYQLARAYFAAGQYDEAEPHANAARNSGQPQFYWLLVARNASTLNDSGIHSAMQGRPAKAIEDFDRSVAIYRTLVQEAGQHEKARQFTEGLVMKFTEGLVMSLRNLAWLYATAPDANCRDGTKAVRHAKLACELTNGNHFHHLDTLAAGYAEMGEFDMAVQIQIKALQQAPQGQGNPLRFRLGLYQAKKPYRELGPN